MFESRGPQLCGGVYSKHFSKPNENSYSLPKATNFTCGDSSGQVYMVNSNGLTSHIDRQSWRNSH